MQTSSEYPGKELGRMAAELEHHALMVWRHSALRVLWRAWDINQRRSGATRIVGLFDAYWKGENEASRKYNRQVEEASDMLDATVLWKGITGGLLDLDSWISTADIYEYILTKRTLDNFEDLVIKMFPLELNEKCTYEPIDPGYPESPNPDTVLRWAVEMMEGSCVTDVYRSLEKGVPLEDLLA